jgi:hypothetical protein
MIAMVGTTAATPGSPFAQQDRAQRSLISACCARIEWSSRRTSVPIEPTQGAMTKKNSAIRNDCGRVRLLCGVVLFALTTSPAQSLNCEDYREIPNRFGVNPVGEVYTQGTRWGE